MEEIIELHQTLSKHHFDLPVALSDEGVIYLRKGEYSGGVYERYDELVPFDQINYIRIKNSL